LSRSAASANGAARLRAELVLWAAVLVLAAFLRLYELGAVPLDLGESRLAFEAWREVHGASAELWREPVVNATTGAVFLLFGDSDALARLIPAVAGVGLVAAVWLLRPFLGAAGALGAALVLAVSPTFVYFSRHLSPDAYAALFALLAGGFALRFARGGSMGSLAGASASMGVLLCSGGPGVTYGLGFAVSIVAAGALEAGEGMVHRGVRRLKEPRLALTAVGAFAAAFIAVSTGLLVEAGRFGLPALGAWVDSFTVRSGGEAWHYPLSVLVLYEPWTAFLGVAACVSWLLSARRDLLSGCLVFLFAFALVLAAVAGEKTPGQVAAVVLPLALLGGGLIGRVLARVEWSRLPRELLTLAPALILAAVGLLLLNEAFSPGTEAVGARRAFAVLAFVGAVMWPLWRMGQGRSPALVAAPLIVAGFIVSGHLALGLGFRGGEAQWFSPWRTSAETAAVSESLVSLQPARYQRPDVQTAVDNRLADPLAWYLRGREQVRFVSAPTPDAWFFLAPDEGTGAVAEGSGVRLELGEQWQRPSFTWARLFGWWVRGEVYGTVRSVHMNVYTPQGS